MKASLLITDQTYQILLEGENDQEIQIIRAMHKKIFTAHESDFTIDLCKADYYNTFSSSTGASSKPKQIVLVTSEPKKDI